MNITPAQATGPITLNNVAAGDFLVLVARLAAAGNINSLSISDPANGAWSQAVVTSLVATNVFFIYYVSSSLGGNITVTVTPGINSSYQMIMAEYAGPAGSPALDQNPAAATGSSSTATSNTATTTQARELLIAMVGNATANGRTLTQGAGFTLRNTSNGNVGLEDQLVTAIGGYSASFGISGTPVTWTCAIATFRMN